MVDATAEPTHAEEEALGWIHTHMARIDLALCRWDTVRAHATLAYEMYFAQQSVLSPVKP